MPEVRTNLSIELHRKLKGEAVNKGMHLKQLVAEVLEEHASALVKQSGSHNPPGNKRHTQ